MLRSANKKEFRFRRIYGKHVSSEPKVNGGEKERDVIKGSSRVRCRKGEIELGVISIEMKRK